MAETIISSFTNFSISFWIKHDNKVTTPLVIFATSSIYETKRFVIYFNQAGNVTVYWCNTSNTSTTMTSVKPTNDYTWHHIVFTHNGQTGRLYIDNELSVSQNWPLSLTSLPNKHVGGWQITGNKPNWFNSMFGNKQYTGYLDEFRIFNKALTEKDIEYLYKYGEERYPDFEDFESLLSWYQEVGFESFFELPKDVGNDLNNLAAFVKLGDARGTLNINDTNRAKEILFPNRYLIQKISVTNTNGNSEVWILNPFTSKNFGLNSSGNFIEMVYTADRSKQGIYNIISYRTVGSYLVFEVSKVPGLDQVSTGGFIYINRDNWKLSKPSYPLFYDRDFGAYTHT